MYKTAEELTKDSSQYRSRPGKGAGSGEGPAVKVIDMTGPRQRVLSGYEEIHSRHTRPDEELQKSECA